MSSSREDNYQEKQEEGNNNSMNNIEKSSKAPSSSSSRQWSSSSLRNPRIVRVSRTFGGKDRHSKVCTIRGLRDRRIRLSVPTAIQLYDLQDKLGLGQPSKVIDWLLEATKFDIDKLPPLQFPQSFSQFHHHVLPQTLLPFHDHQSSNVLSHELSLGPMYDPNSSTFVGIQNLMARSKFWDVDSTRVGKGKEVEREYFCEKGKSIKTNDEENQVGEASYNNFHQVSTQKLFPMETQSSFLNNAMSYNNNYHSEASSLSLSQFGSNHGLFQSHHQQVDPNQSNGNAFQFPFSFQNSQLLFGPSSSTQPSSSLLNNPFMNNSLENDPKVPFNHFHFSNSSSSQAMPHSLIPSFHHPFNPSPIRPFPIPFSSKLLDSDNNDNSNQMDGRDCRDRS